MRATGIVRRIDDLGRIVIPKELRKSLRLKEGETLEIFTQDDGSITLKKYSAFTNISDHAQIYAESLSAASDFTVIITDTQRIIAAAYKGSRIAFGNGELNEQFYKNILTKKNTDSSSADKNISVTDELVAPQGVLQSIAPIVSMGDVVGSAVIYYDGSCAKYATQSAKTAALFFNKLLAQ